MAAPIRLRDDFDAPALRALAKASRDPDQLRRLLSLAGCCQSNANRSPKSARSGLSGRKPTPFGQSGRSVLLEDIAAV